MAVSCCFKIKSSLSRPQFFHSHHILAEHTNQSIILYSCFIWLDFLLDRTVPQSRGINSFLILVCPRPGKRSKKVLRRWRSLALLVVNISQQMISTHKNRNIIKARRILLILILPQISSLSSCVGDPCV